MKLKVTQTASLGGTICPPSSKSQSIRALLFSLIAQGESFLENLLDSTDTENALNVIEQLGAETTTSINGLKVKGNGVPLKSKQKLIHTGNSGITTLFALPLLGLRGNHQEPIQIDCGKQMRQRPVKPLLDALEQLGLKIEYLEKEGCLPVQIEGKLLGGEAEIEGENSQYLSALLIALPCAEKDSVITVKNLLERPYIEMTTQWLDRQNIRYTHTKLNESDIFKIKGRQSYKGFNTKLSGDFSSASYFLAAGALFPGSLEIEGLNMKDPQGDKKLVEILKKMGADISIDEEKITLHGGNPLRGIPIDASDIPDLLPTLAVIGTYASGTTRIYNTEHARIKETDRIESMTQGLSKMGAQITEHPDGMTIHQSELKGAHVKGYEDHRTVMALSLAGMLAEGETLIDDPDAINKTFPNFVELMQSIGAKMEVSNDDA